MNGSELVDFHQGWLVEIVHSERGFLATCYSPCRKCVLVQEQHASDLEALYAAQQAINYQIACSSLATVMRDFYERGYLEFEEWTLLQQSLK
jgi:hypothetical protein